MLIEPIDVLSEPSAPREEAFAPDALPPVVDISPLPDAIELLPVPFESTPAVRLKSPIMRPPVAPTLLSPPENAEAPSPPDFPLELMFELIDTDFPLDKFSTYLQYKTPFFYC
jgi:hypothetical protein